MQGKRRFGLGRWRADENGQERLGDGEEPKPAERYPGLTPLSLGDINENRRESVARRLRALRERPPRTPEGEPESPAEPARDDPAQGPARPGPGGDLAERLSVAGERIADAWSGLPKIARQRMAAAAIVIALVGVVVLIVAPAAPCGAPGGDACPPSDDAIEIVPDDALAYVHANIDPDTDQYAEAAALASRIPLLSRLAIAAVSSDLGRIDFNTQVRPWAGGELAVALLPGTRRLDPVVMVEVEDTDGAGAFAAQLLGPDPDVAVVGGTEVSTASRGTATTAAAVFEGFLLLGGPGAIADIVDPDAERGALADDPAATGAMEELTDDRLVEAYLSPAGARAVVSDPSLAPFDTFVDSEATAGVGLALGAADSVLALEIRSTLDPERAETSPSFFAALPPFEPELTADVGSDALAYLGLGDPGTGVNELLGQASADAPEILAAFEGVERDLRKQAGVSIVADLLPLLGSEVALSVEPQRAEVAAPAPGTLAPSGVPYASLIAAGIDGGSAARSLANLQEPLVDALGASQGAPLSGFETAKIAGVDARSLLVNPDINLTYAVFDDRLVIATNPVGIAQARAEGEGLSTAAGFEEVTAGLPDAVSLLAYLDLRGLLSLGEEIGLGLEEGYATLAPDLRSLESGALAVTDSEGTIRTDLRIALAGPGAAEVETPAPGSE